MHLFNLELNSGYNNQEAIWAAEIIQQSIDNSKFKIVDLI